MATKTKVTVAMIGPFSIQQTGEGDEWAVFEGLYFDSAYPTKEEAIIATCEGYVERLRVKLEAILDHLDPAELATVKAYETALNALNGVQGDPTP